MTLNEAQRKSFQWLAREAGLEPLGERDWRVIELAQEFFDRPNGNSLRAIITDLEQERIALLAARRMQRDGVTKTDVANQMVDYEICWALRGGIMSRDSIEGYLRGRPRGKKPEDYLEQESRGLGLLSIDGLVEDWEERAGIPITDGAPGDW